MSAGPFLERPNALLNLCLTYFAVFLVFFDFTSPVLRVPFPQGPFRSPQMYFFMYVVTYIFFTLQDGYDKLVIDQLC